MYYINYKEKKHTVTVNEFKTKEEAEAALAEMYSDKEYYISTRATKAWKEAKDAEELVNEEVEAEEEEAQEGDEYTTLDDLLENEAEVDPDEDYEDVDDEDACDCEGDCTCCNK